MTDRENSFHHDTIDEQIEQYKQSAFSHHLAVDSDADTRLLHDLRLMYQEEERQRTLQEDQQAVRRAWTRLEAAYPHQKQSTPLPTQTASALEERQSWRQKLGMLAAVAVVALLIGSTIMIFALPRNTSTINSTPTMSASPQSETPTQPPIKQTETPMPSAKQGATIFVHEQGGVGAYGVRWSPDGKRILSYSSVVHIWGPAEGAEVITYPTEALLPRLKNTKPDKLDGKTLSGVFIDAQWSPDGKLFAIPVADDIEIWDTGSAKLITTLSYTFPEKTTFPYLTFLNWSQDSTSLSVLVTMIDAISPSSNYIVTFYDIPSGDTTWQKSEGVRLEEMQQFFRVAWSPDRSLLAAAHLDRGNVYIIDTSSGRTILTYPGPGTVVDLAWSPDSKSVAVGFGDGLDVTHRFDVKTGDNLVIHNGANVAVDWSPDGKYLAAALFIDVGKSDVIEIWDAATGKTLFTYKDHKGHVHSIDWSPDGKTIASGEGSDDGKLSNVRVWRAIG